MTPGQAPDTGLRDGRDPTGVLTFVYRNYRGEIAERHVRGHSAVWTWGVNKWHPEPQWFLSAIDIDKKDGRDFAAKDILYFGPLKAAALAPAEALEQAREALAPQPMETAPRDGTPILLLFGLDTLATGWWTGNAEYPWSFVDTGLVGEGTGVNGAKEGKYGPSGWLDPRAVLSSLPPSPEKYASR